MSVEFTKKLMASCHATGHAMIFRGLHGIGKSTIPAQYAKENNYYFEHQFATGQETSDLVGLTKERAELLNGEEVVIQYWTQPVWLWRIWKNHYLGIKTVLLIDEVNRANEEVIQMTLSILNDRKIHEHKLPPDCLILTAINPESSDQYEGVDYNVKFLDKAIYSRVFLVDLSITVPEWLRWAESNGINRSIISFISQNPTQLYCNIPTQTNFADPRSWEKFSDVLNLEESNLTEGQQFSREYLIFISKSKIGESTGYLFTEFYLNQTDFSLKVYKGIVSRVTSKTEYQDLLNKINSYPIQQYEQSLFMQDDKSYEYTSKDETSYKEYKRIFYDNLIPEISHTFKKFYKNKEIDNPQLLNISSELFKEVVLSSKDRGFLSLVDIVFYMSYLYSLDKEIAHGSLKEFKEYCNTELEDLMFFLKFNNLDNERYLVNLIKTGVNSN
jgi:hypothetical protein